MLICEHPLTHNTMHVMQQTAWLVQHPYCSYNSQAVSQVSLRYNPDKTSLTGPEGAVFWLEGPQIQIRLSYPVVAAFTQIPSITALKTMIKHVVCSKMAGGAAL